MGLIATRQTDLSSNADPATAFAVVWVGIIWLSMIEGGQGSLVGLAPINSELYKFSHPISYMGIQVAHHGDNLDRYLLGRQFMVCMVVFVVNIAGSPADDAELWGYPEWVKNFFFKTGFVMILFTAMVGQLASQVNGSLNMLDYINNYSAILTFWVAMAIEFSGILHSSYLMQYLLSAFSGEEIESNEPSRTFIQCMFFWLRCLYSLTILIFCLAVKFNAFLTGKIHMWGGVPWIVFIIFCLLMVVVGMLEGMQIASFAVAKLAPSERGDCHFAKLTCELLFKGEGDNLPRFMIGRQLAVVSCMFCIARLTSVSIPEGGENIFELSDALQAFFNFGIAGALITTIIGSIASQLVASAFPVAFLANPFTFALLRLCLFLESSGVCHGAWVLAFIQKKAWGFQRDEVYIGTAMERAEIEKGDHTEHLHLGPGHIVKLPNFALNASQTLKNILERNILKEELLERNESFESYINSIYDDYESDRK